MMPIIRIIINSLLLLALLATADIITTAGERDHRITPDFLVVGYLPEWRYEGANYKTLCKHLTHLLLFSLEPTPNGGITALDRLPGDDVMEEIHAAAKNQGDNTKIMVCFGGNRRSGGFSKMVQSPKARSLFVANVVELCEKHGLAGVDYNWEYPGYTFGRGYQSHEMVDADYQGLAQLVEETRDAFQRSNREDLDTITLAYYPDTMQERLLMKHGIANHVDLMHSMSYDQSASID
jgi:chitinase